MATRQEINMAISALKQHQQDFGRRHSRIHVNTADDNFHRKRALDGICGSCNALIIEINSPGRYKEVKLRCREGAIPLDLYRKTELGQTPVCDTFTRHFLL